MNTLDACKKTRKIAADSLALALTSLLKTSREISEVMLRDAWLSEIRKHTGVFPEGWYIPPPHGMTVLFATETHTDRVCPQAIRPEKYWPKPDVYLDCAHGLAFVYASVVDKVTGMIGDFGLTLYFGSRSKITNHLKTCYDVDRMVFDYARIGMTFSALNKYTHELIRKNGLISDLASSTDPMNTNTGHTIPGTDVMWTSREMKMLQGSDWKKTLTMISRKRVFVNSVEPFRIKPGTAFTIEPRPYSVTDKTIPMAFFHMIAMFHKNGKEEFLTDFDELFKLTGMHYLLT